MADETVKGEPVCEGKFPANREIYREFYENRAVWQKIARENAAKSVSCRTIPYKMKQGINLRRTGNLLSRAGNLQRLAGKLPASFLHRGCGHGLILSCSSEFEFPRYRISGRTHRLLSVTQFRSRLSSIKSDAYKVHALVRIQ
jgi:hypothetical protein